MNTADLTRTVPASIATMHDIGKLQRELAALQQYFSSAAKRPSGSPMALPATTSQLENIARQNDCNLLHEADRDKLARVLVTIRQQAKPVDISFAGIPSAMFLQKIVTWFRTNVHKDIVLNVGHDPSIASGCVVRTAHKTYDLSLGHKLLDNRQVLIDLIHSSNYAKNML